jgi:prevent-host-death family protein
MTTIASEDMRKTWGATLDRVFKGEQLVVERFGRPMAVLLGLDEWKALQGEIARLKRTVQADKDFADMRQGKYTEG